MRFARSANGIYESLQSPDFEAYFIITEDASFRAPTAQYCDEIRRQYGLTMPVLFDGAQVVPRTYQIAENHSHVVLESGARIIYKAHYDDDAFVPIIEDALRR